MLPNHYGRRRAAMPAGPRPRRIRRFLEPALLLQLHYQPSHGYKLVEGLDALGMESYPAAVSAVYRILYDLEAAGMITSTRESEQTAGPPRRVYALTEAGEVYLSAWVQELRETDRLLHRFLEAYESHMEQHKREASHPPSQTTDKQGESR